MGSNDIRSPAVAGQFYPNKANILQAEVNDYLAKAVRVELGQSILGLVAPHAGYMFSGQTAAYAYKQVQDITYDAIIIVAPSHRDYFKGSTVYNGKGYETPLGVALIDQDLAAAVAKQDRWLSLGTEGHGLEHSLEVQLPFIQTVQQGVPIVPIVMGEQGLAGCRVLAQAITAARGRRRLLLVASSDLSHFHPYKEARKLDAVVNRYIEGFDPEGLGQSLAGGDCEACGGGPIISVMLAARELGADRARVLHHVNSGDIIGDKSGVVGYTAAVIYKT